MSWPGASLTRVIAQALLTICPAGWGLHGEPERNPTTMATGGDRRLPISR